MLCPERSQEKLIGSCIDVLRPPPPHPLTHCTPSSAIVLPTNRIYTHTHAHSLPSPALVPAKQPVPPPRSLANCRLAACLRAATHLHRAAALTKLPRQQRVVRLLELFCLQTLLRQLALPRAPRARQAPLKSRQLSNGRVLCGLHLSERRHEPRMLHAHGFEGRFDGRRVHVKLGTLQAQLLQHLREGEEDRGGGSEVGRCRGEKGRRRARRGGEVRGVRHHTPTELCGQQGCERSTGTCAGQEEASSAMCRPLSG
eukprot:366484-Chlamydomonas_euryale.AAC.3